jgi:PAS domain S-box-containing protein
MKRLHERTDVLDNIKSLQLVLAKVIMPANDFLITKDMEELENFKVLTKDVEALMENLEGMELPSSREQELLVHIKREYFKAKDISFKIFSASSLAGNAEPGKLMEEMDGLIYDAAEDAEEFHQIIHKEIERFEEAWQKSKAKLNLVFSLGILCSLALILLAIIFFRRAVSIPIISLRNAAIEVGKGNLDTRLEVKQKDEIGELISVFNKMCSDLKLSRRELLASKNYIDTVIANIVDSIIVIDTGGLIRKLNKATLDLLGYREEEIIDQPAARLFEDEEEILNDVEEQAFLLSEDFRILKVNNAFLKTIGLNREDVIGEPCYKITHNRDSICEPPHDKCPIKESIQKNQPCVQTHTHFDNIGRSFLVNVVSTPVRDKTGKVIYYLHLARKIKDYETAYRSGEDVEKVKGLVKKLEDYAVNLERQRIFKEGAIENLNKLGSLSNLELYYKSKIGEKILVNFSGSLMKDERGNLIGIVCVARDIREIKKLEGQLIKSEKLAAIGELAAGVAHEINNPLNVISGNAELLLKGTDNEEVKIATTVIMDQVKRAASITKRLLQFSKTIEPQTERVYMNRLLEETLPLLRYQVNVDNIEIIKELDPRIPEILADPGRLQEVFLNIMLNAVQAMPRGGQLTIRTYIEEVAEETRRRTDIFKKGNKIVVIKFKDTGTGISKEKIKKIFSPFFTTKEQGTGLGLSICHGIIEAHMGSIDVESELGKGTTFIIKLPV